MGVGLWVLAWQLAGRPHISASGDVPEPREHMPTGNIKLVIKRRAALVQKEPFTILIGNGR